MTRTPRPWIPHGPEDRLSIVTVRFLDDALVPPFYATALSDDDEGQRSANQRMRGWERGQKPGQLDIDVVQGHLVHKSPSRVSMEPLARKVELKRGKNKLSDHQTVTVKKLLGCGARPIIAWNLREVHAGMVEAGFRFHGNVETLLQKYEAQLEAMDRTAELTLSGNAPAKKSRARKSEPRATAPKSVTKRWTAAGLKF